MNTNIKRSHNKSSALYHFPKVSIIVATYRRIESLDRSLKSLITQSYSNYEIIVIDDNANPEWNLKVELIIKDIISSGSAEIIYIKNKENKGSAETRNIGIKRASGEYITFLDDDDIYLPDKVKSQVDYMINEGLDFSITDLWLYDEKNKLIEKRTRNYIKDFSPENLLKYHLMFHMTGTDVMMFKKKYLMDIGLFPRINIGDEFYLIQKAIEGRGTFGYLPRCEVRAYVHNSTEGLSSGDGKIKGENELYRYKKSYFDKLSNEEKRYVRMRHYAVIAYTSLRDRRYMSMFGNLCISFASSPVSFLNLYINRK